MNFYSEDNRTALSAKEEAQKLAFAPVAFQAAQSLRELGILTALDGFEDSSATAKQLAINCDLSEYAVAVLLDMGLSAGLVIWNEPNYKLTKLGQFVEFDKMTHSNMDFVADICYHGMAELTESVTKLQPAGLKHLGSWSTLYEGLSSLNPRQKRSWFDFDHYYSDRSFPILLEKVFSSPVKTLCDIGANTGKWTKKCCEYDESVVISMVDLPQQLNIAQRNISEAGYSSRVKSVPRDLLDPRSKLPENQDVYWMSQFLDCFSKEEIVSILVRVKESMNSNSKIFILELFPDCQDYESASYSLNATSLYFTAIANGNSRFYMSHEFLPLIELAGLETTSITHGIGLGHSLIECSLP